MIIDPLEGLDVTFSLADVSRDAFVYFDNAGERCWTKAWFNGYHNGEPAVEITREQAINFIKGRISRDSWLSAFYPDKMAATRDALAVTRRSVLGID